MGALVIHTKGFTELAGNSREVAIENLIFDKSYQEIFEYIWRSLSSFFWHNFVYIYKFVYRTSFPIRLMILLTFALYSGHCVEHLILELYLEHEDPLVALYT